MEFSPNQDYLLDTPSGISRFPTGITGICFNYRVYLFYQFSTFVGGCRISYDQVEPVEKDGKSILKSNRKQEEFINHTGDIGGLGTGFPSLAGCERKGNLYLFWNSTAAGAIRYVCCTSSAEGVLLNQPFPGESAVSTEQMTIRTIPNFPVSSAKIAAVEIENRLFVFANRDNKLAIAYSDDGISWKTEIADNWINVGNLAACCYSDNQGRPSLMFGMASSNNNVWTGRYDYDPTAPGSGLICRDTCEHVELRGQCDQVALAVGSLKEGSGGNLIQLFINGQHGATWSGWQRNKKKEFNISTNIWNELQQRREEDSYSRLPTWSYMSAFTSYRKVSEQKSTPQKIWNVQQEIWNVMTYYQSNSSNTGYFCVARWQSDVLEFIRSDRSTDLDVALCPLIGVVEGTPPYALNGETFSPTASVFSFGRESSKTASVTTSFKIGAYCSVGAVVEEVGPSLKIAAELISEAEESSISTRSINTRIKPEPGNPPETTYFYLVPTIYRVQYSLLDCQGKLISDLYIYNVIDFTLKVVQKNKLPDGSSRSPADLRSWYQRFTDLPAYVDQTRSESLRLTWNSGTSVDTELSRIKSLSQSSTTEVSAEVSLKGGGIFDMGGNISFSYRATSIISDTERISFALDYPPARHDHPEDISYADVRMYLLYPNEQRIDECYWIPTSQPKQRPWCIAWSVDDIKTVAEQEQAMKQVGNDAEIATTLD